MLGSKKFSPGRELLKGLLLVLGAQPGAGAEAVGGQQAGDDETGAGGKRLAANDGVGPEEGGCRAASGDPEER